MALLRHVVEGVVIQRHEGAQGVTYAVEGPPRTPDGRNPPFRTVWLVEWDQPVPRFVTGYPSA